MLPKKMENDNKAPEMSSAEEMYMMLTPKNKEKVIRFVESLKAEQCTHQP